MDKLEYLKSADYTLVYIVLIAAVYYTIKHIVSSIRNVKLAQHGYVADDDGSTYKDEPVKEEDAKNG